MNLPNLLATFRILLDSTNSFWFLVDRQNPVFEGWHESWFDYFAGLIFVIASMTDFFDGFIARQWDQMTNLRSILDPLCR